MKRDLLNTLVAGGFIAALLIALIGWIATQQDRIVADKCDRMGRVMLDGKVYECRRIAATRPTEDTER